MEYKVTKESIDVIKTASMLDGGDTYTCACHRCTDCFSADSELYRVCPGCGTADLKSGAYRCDCGTILWVCNDAETEAKVVTMYCIGEVAKALTVRDDVI